MSITVPNDAVATVPLIFEDQVGRVVTAPPPDGAATSSDATVLTAAMSADLGSVVLTPVGPTGTVNVVYAGGGLTVTESVAVVTPLIASVAFNESAVTFVEKGA